MSASSAERLTALRAEQDTQFNMIQAIKDVAEDQDRDLTEDEEAKLNACAERMAEIQKRIPNLERLVEIENQYTGSKGRKVNFGTDQTRSPQQPAFTDFGDFLQNVCKTGRNREYTPALRSYVNAGQSTSVGSEGGFLLPPEFRETIYTAVTGSQSLASRCTNYTTLRNAIEWVAYEATPWGTSGLQVYWEGEAQAPAATGVTLDPRVLRLNKLFAWVPITNEAIEDAPFLLSFVQQELTKALNETITQAIVRGPGGAKHLLGILNSPALISVAKESGQTADTLVINNILKAYQRIKPTSIPNTIALYNQEILFQLYSMSLATGAATSGMVFMPPGGLSARPYGTIMGMDMVPCQSCSALGDLGDILFADLSEYVLLTKAAGPRIDLDMSFYFDTDRSALRVIYRVGGFPLPSQAVTPRYGNATVSPFVAIAERA